MKILDLTAGNRAVWFNKKHPDAVYLDIRPEMKPDIVVDCTRLSEFSNQRWDLIVFDPPHVNCGKNGYMATRYGHWTAKEIRAFVENASKEAAKISGSETLMAFKWNDHDIKLKTVLDLMPDWEPLFGHLTKDGPGSKTYWVMLKRGERSGK